MDLERCNTLRRCSQILGMMDLRPDEKVILVRELSGLKLTGDDLDQAKVLLQRAYREAQQAES